MIIAAALLDAPCVRADAGLIAVLDRYAVDRLDHAPRTTSVADRVRSLLRDELGGGEPTAAQTAARLKMSVRSLNRVLAAEGTSYRELLDALRRDLAARLVKGGDASIAEVAFFLGFSELSSFHRAFKRWTGRTPAEFRRQAQAGPRNDGRPTLVRRPH